MVYIVTFDLGEPTQRYEELVSLIKDGSRWARLCHSSYLIVSDLSAVQLRDKFKVALDGNDRLYVGSIKAPAAWTGMPDSVTKWIKDEL